LHDYLTAQAVAYFIISLEEGEYGIVFESAQTFV
jgi:hypothetical protein